MLVALTDASHLPCREHTPSIQIDSSIQLFSLLFNPLKMRDILDRPDGLMATPFRLLSILPMCGDCGTSISTLSFVRVLEYPKRASSASAFRRLPPQALYVSWRTRRHGPQARFYRIPIEVRLNLVSCYSTSISQLDARG